MARVSSSSVRATKWMLLFELACLALAAATAVLGVSAAPPSAADLAHCPKSCGGVNISYPLGIGRGCFRPGFEVTCNHSTKHPKLFLGNDTITQIVEQFQGYADVRASIVFNIATTRPGALGIYNRSWEAPGRSFITAVDSTVVIVGCGFEAFLFDSATGPGNLLGYCTSMCRDMAALEKEAEGGGCSGMGCCNIELYRSVSAFRLSIVQKEEAVPAAFVNSTVKAFLEEGGDEYTFSMDDLLSDKVNKSTIGAVTTGLWAVMTDHPNCRTAKKHELYACASNNSCRDYDDGIVGYWCYCPYEFSYGGGSPYIVDGGCTEEYNPSHEKFNCSRSCGSTSIPFPFGLEPNCSANKKFLLNCTSNQPLIGQGYAQYQVVNISVPEGLLFVNKTYDPKFVSYGGYGEELLRYVMDIDMSEQYGIWKWAVSNTTCDVAKKQRETRYACISENSECTNVTHGHVYIGYRCQCSHGYEGNPYVRNGCNDTNECLIPYKCNGTCHNLVGSFNCTSCPQGTVFDVVETQCTSSKHRSLVFGM